MLEIQSLIIYDQNSLKIEMFSISEEEEEEEEGGAVQIEFWSLPIRYKIKIIDYLPRIRYKIELLHFRQILKNSSKIVFSLSAVSNSFKVQL